MAGTQFNQIGFDEEENLLRFVCSETVESKLVKRYSDTSHNDEFSLMKVYTYTMPTQVPHIMGQYFATNYLGT